MNKQNDFDVHLPRFTVEPLERSLSDQRPVSWGVEYLQVNEVWPDTKGKGVIAFIIDTEDGTTHEAVEASTIHPYCKRFTNEPPTPVQPPKNQLPIWAWIAGAVVVITLALLLL